MSKEYRRGSATVHALEAVDLEIEPGTFVVLLGPSGSGKTTLLNLVGSIEVASAGTLEVGGHDLGALDGDDLTAFRRAEVGFVFQFFNLVPTLTAVENVELIADLTGPRALERSKAALASVGLEDRADHFPSELSGGEQQRVAVARALVKEPSVLLADEPTGSLDLESGRQVLGLLRRAASDGHTVIVVTHNGAIAEIADRVVSLKDGRVDSDDRRPDPLPVELLEW